MEVTGLHGRFPHLALLLFAVAHQAKDLVVLAPRFFAVDARGQRHAHRDAQTLAERARRNLNARQLEPMGMALVGRAELAQGDDVVERAKTGDAERHIECRRLVAGRPENAVAIGPVRVFRIVLGDAEIKCRGNVHDGERAAGVSRARRAQRNQVVAAHQLRRVAQFVDGIFLPHLPGGCISKRHCRSPLRDVRPTRCYTCAPTQASIRLSASIRFSMEFATLKRK